MILLFLSVWAIVIALNEVLFAAQPFSLTTIAAAMPHTLMFSVVLSAAVYIAKKRIIDAVSKGRPIDKRFVAELTPEVGHQLNSMRRKLEAMDNDGTPGKKVKGKKKGRNFPSDMELVKANKEIAARNKEKFDRLHENTQAQMRQEQLRKQKEEAKAAARSKAAKQAKLDDSHQLSQEQAFDNEQNDRGSLVGDPNDFVKEAHAQMMEQAQSRIEAAQRRRKEHDLQIQRQNAPSMGENRARLAKEKELQKERREAQIKALGALSKEEKAAEEARRSSERALEQERAALAAKAEAAARMEAAAKAQAREMAKARAEAEAREKMEAEKRAMAKVKELAAAKARASTAAKAREQELRYKIEQEAKLKARQEEKARKEAQARKEAIDRSNQKLQEEAAKAQEQAKAQESEKKLSKVENTQNNDAKRQMDFEIVANQDKKAAPINVSESPKERVSGGIEYVDQIEIPKGGLDTSSLKPYQMPKRGAGLDTSALKKAKLNKSSSSSLSAQMAKLTNNSRATLSNATLSKTGLINKGKVSNVAQAKAMSTILNHDTNLDRGDVQTLELSKYQANVRARALSRAQGTKASEQEKNSALVSRPDKAKSVKQAQAQAQNGPQGPQGPASSQGAKAPQGPQAMPVQDGAQGNTMSQAKSPNMGGPANGVAMRRSAATQNSAHNEDNKAQAAQSALGAKGPIGLGTTIEGLPQNYIGSQAAPVRQVVTTSNKVQARPQGNNLPKTVPSNPLGNIQTAPVMRARSNISAQSRDNLFSNAMGDKMVSPTDNDMQSKTDLIHAQANANAYMKMQTQTAPLARKNKQGRVRPSQMLESNEVV